MGKSILTFENEKKRFLRESFFVIAVLFPFSGDRNQTVLFTLDAFDEPWKGGNDPSEPEKHWGLFQVDRTPKPFMAKPIKLWK